MSLKFLAAAFALFAIIAPASADVVTVTATGTVSSGADTYGLFGTVGSDLTGTQFTAVYTFNLSDATNTQTFPNGSGSEENGGPPTGYPPFASWFPSESVVFTINNRSITYGAATWATYVTTYRLIQYVFQSSNYGVTTVVESPSFGFPSTLDSSFGPVNGQDINQDSYFSYSNEYFPLNTTTVTQSVSGVPLHPLPLLGQMLLLGLGSFGLVAYRRKSNAHQIA
jgi:hypothetical protein